MDINQEFDEIFKDILGKLDVPKEVKENIQESIKEKTPQDRFAEFHVGLVKFAEEILSDDKLQMYGIHHALHYIAAKKADYERGSKYTCHCGKEFSLRVWNDVQMLDMDRSLKRSLQDSGHLYFSPMSYRDEIVDQIFCPFCGQAFRTRGIIISMKCDAGVEIG